MLTDQVIRAAKPRDKAYKLFDEHGLFVLITPMGAHWWRLKTAHRAHQNCGQIFRYAIATGRAERDLAADLRGALPPVTGRHLASITDSAGIGAYSARLMGTREHSSRGVPCVLHRWCSYAPANCGKRSGRNST